MPSSHEWTDFGPDEAREYIRSRRNWGRWGADDQVGAVNLITPEKSASAARLVRTGQSISLSRPLPTKPATNNPRPVQHFAGQRGRPEGVAEQVQLGAGVAVDFVGVASHGMSVTHIDALCHTWDSEGMWNGRSGEGQVGLDGSRWGGIQHWSSGIFTRGILLDVPRFRGEEYVTYEKPVLGSELEEIMRETGVEPEPGDAVIVYSGREAFSREHGEWGSPIDGKPATGPVNGREVRAGLHTSCLQPLREWDSSVLVWDMLEQSPNEYGLPWNVHAAIFAFGMAFIDNALLEPLAEACREAGRSEFLFTVAPLIIEGGTGSPVNPIVVL